MMNFSCLKHQVVNFVAGLALLPAVSGLVIAQEALPQQEPSQQKKEEKGKKGEVKGQRVKQPADRQDQPIPQREPRPMPQREMPPQQRDRGQRLPTPEQQQRIQTQRLNQYDQQRQRQDRLAQQREQRLQQQQRQAHLRFQQQYLDRVRQDQAKLRNAHPYEAGALNYRYWRGGRSYQTSQRGANMLRQALNHGYQEGYQAGQADRADRASFSYRDAYAYQDATYGYDGYDVDLSEYRYYFQEGFNRGYQDGFYSRFRYGSNNNGVFNLSDNILLQVFNARPY